MIYRIRVILDVKEDVFRDIEIDENDTLEDLHNIIVQSFSLDGMQMSSFYVSDEEWNQGEEISLFDMSDGSKALKTMSGSAIHDFLQKKHDRMLYVYDFLNIKTFYVELFDVKEAEGGVVYPIVALSYGDSQDWLDGEFEEIDDPDAIEYDDESEDGDIFDGDDEFGQMGFDGGAGDYGDGDDRW